ncbi:uncharacterized protein LOC126882460 [Diabrotica virgifera virgifera]|uniref:Uncharacterized protein n=1 Tax=Diabrotica virgifera virgifera TaxID=50390 RepID=A0ABM5JZL2_DIAVI|nr:uncharacterized protein LOC126882460 [Diabrotica virgifera virgifera]
MKSIVKISNVYKHVLLFATLKINLVNCTMAKTIFLLAITLTICVSYLSALMDPTKIPGFEECIKSSGATAEELMKSPVVLNHNVFCFFKCTHEKKGSLDADGNVVVDNFIEGAKKHMTLSADQEKSLTDCLEAVGKISACEDVEKIAKCIMPIK